MPPAPEIPISRIPAVNVASVPQRSPLRYPGGKTWLIPHIREWLGRTRPEILIEPFAGGATASLTAVMDMEELARSCIMIEIDPEIAAFWRVALSDGSALAKCVRKFELTREKILELEKSSAMNDFDHAFRALVRNRTRSAGIMAPGASLLRHGENGKGVASRWYPETLATRLEDIENHAGRIDFREGDGLRLLEPLLREHGHCAAVFVDPPYTAGGKRAGARLYNHNEIDHERLFRILADRQANFLMTYDCAPEILDLVDRHGFYAVKILMKNAHHDRIAELAVTRTPLFA